jgi:hypothetical protein
MQRTSEAAARIREIEALQDDVLVQLEELERRTAEVLARHLPPGPPALDAPIPGDSAATSADIAS